jgi:hypothetical protein
MTHDGISAIMTGLCVMLLCVRAICSQAKRLTQISIRCRKHWNKKHLQPVDGWHETWPASNEARSETEHIRRANKQGVQLNQYRTNVRIETEHIRAMNEQSIWIIQHETNYVGAVMSRVSKSVSIKLEEHQSTYEKASDSVRIRPREHWNNARTDCGRAACEI